MTSSRERRVAKELQDLEADRVNSGVYATSVDGVSLKNLIGTITGPPDTPYAGGSYQVEITIPDQYPFKSPHMKFLTRIWHPNISSQTGAICLDTLSSGWSPVQTIKTALLSIRVLLEVPSPKDPQDAEVAKMLLENPPMFAKKANEWAVRHAGATPSESFSQYAEAPKKPPQDDSKRYGGYNKEMIDNYVNMGFEVERVVEIFRKCGIFPAGGLYQPIPEQFHAYITGRLLGE